MKTIVISGSAKLQDEVNHWIGHFKKANYEILDHPKLIDQDSFEKVYPTVLKNFYAAIETADAFFLMNEEKNGVKGYIGASGIAELTYAVIQNLLHNKQIEIYILNEPSREVPAYDEVAFWLKMGWVKLYKERSKA